ncbi:ABC transporter permease [Aggregicoccus sp. 17bor-14]|uniref:ABC transporter permease n=1 Tax=Myxococcaceae TaxID=31 RepID=UPI00129CE944|nr:MULTISPECIES: ABC transporter permease [Myxococcaceae]MBF5043479.1 ABC transporter permease [Simulacricoccus sp. 17bor-14]MRI89237.1 ABC transporter permease [Aggregicoccus sp. 17bor-14]
MTTLLQDLRFALRTLLRRPGFTLAVVLTLALGIGANSAIFATVEAVLLRPLPLREPERVVQVWGTHPDVGEEAASLPDFRDWRDGQSAVRLAALANSALNLTGLGEPQRVPTGGASADFFEVMGAAPALGRGFTAQEARTGQGQVVVLSHGFWKRQLGGSPSALGRTLTLDGRPYTVVGVAPEGLEAVFPRLQLWVPLPDDSSEARRADFLRVYGRLAPGASVESAQAQLRAVAARLTQEHPDTNARWSVAVRGLHAEFTRPARPALLLFSGAVALVLLIACANVANLLLAQGAARERELAVRTALGASRGRLVRQLLTESLLLSCLGGALGLLFAVWGADALVQLRPRALQGLAGGVDAVSVLFTLGLSLLTGVLFGLVPALRLARAPQGTGLLRQASGGAGGGRRLRGALVLAEVALALMLLVGAGLLVRSFGRLQQVDPGFEPAGVLSGVLSLPEARYAKDADEAALYGRLLERVNALPGVERAALASNLPLSGGGNYLNMGIEGRDSAGDGPQDAETASVSARYFEALHIPLREGRTFAASDVAGAPDVAVVNEALVRRFFGGKSPLGARVTLDGKRYFRIVGVVGDVRSESLGEQAYRQLYVPLAQVPAPRVMLAVRAAGGTDAAALALSPGVRRELAALDAQLPLAEVQPLSESLGRELSAPRVNVRVLGLFAAVALLLAALGIYGVMAYAVAQRTREIGIRMALGADAADVLRLVVRQGMAPALLGVGAGLAGALATSRLLSGLLYGVAATDLATFALVPLGLLAVALLAAWLPARRATHVDPTEALRAE